MIKSKADYKEYIEADRLANHYPSRYRSWVICHLGFGYNLLYLKYLRKCEYIYNCRYNERNVLFVIIYKLFSLRLKHLSIITGISIPPNTFGKGLYIPHWGSIVVNGSARFGDYCVVQNGVNISEGVVGGNHIYLAAGSKILRNVDIASDVIVGANAVVNKSITEPNVVVAGVPAKVISRNGFKHRMII